MRNWLRSPSKSVEWLGDSIRYRNGAIKTIELIDGWRVVCHPYAFKVFDRDQLRDPEQSLEFRNFLSHCNENMLLFDVGAHFGIFSLAAAQFGGRAVAVDPSPMATKMIAIEAELNNSVDRICILQATVTKFNGITPMLNSGVFSDGYFTAAPGRSDASPTQAITIDELSAKFGAPTHIKIDVEGQEADVICGAQLTLQQFAPVLFLELHTDILISNGADPKSVLNDLFHFGYNCFALDGQIMSTEVPNRPITRLVAKSSLLTAGKKV